MLLGDNDPLRANPALPSTAHWLGPEIQESLLISRTHPPTRPLHHKAMLALLQNLSPTSHFSPDT